MFDREVFGRRKTTPQGDKTGVLEMFGRTLQRGNLVRSAPYPIRIDQRTNLPRLGFEGKSIWNTISDANKPRSRETHDPTAWPWASYNNAIQPISSAITSHQPPDYNHTGLLNISLLVAGATPGGILADLDLHAATPSTVNGSGTATDEVSESPLRSTSTAEGGLISIR